MSMLYNLTVSWKKTMVINNLYSEIVSKIENLIKPVYLQGFDIS